MGVQTRSELGRREETGVLTVHVVINGPLLAQELRLLCQVANSKAIPILNNVLFQATDVLQLVATNLQIELRSFCPATIREPGTVTLPAKALLDLVERLQPDTDVVITLVRGHVGLTCGVFASRLQTLPAEDFPHLPPRPDDSTLILPGPEFCRLMDNTLFAVADKAQKHLMEGAYFTVTQTDHGTVMGMVATDGKRLSLSTALCHVEHDTKITIPRQTIELLRPFCDGHLTVAFCHTANHMWFATAKRQLMSRMLEGTYPNYERIIPKNCDKNLRVDRTLFAATLRRVGVVTEENKAVLLQCEPGTLTVSASSAVIGEALEPVPVQYDGPSLTLCVNGRYVLDFLEHAANDRITISATNESSAVLLTDGDNFLNVVITLRV